MAHFAIAGMPDLTLLTVCVTSTLVFAQVSAVIANRTDTAKLHRVTGILLTGSGAVMLAVKLFTQLR